MPQLNGAFAEHRLPVWASMLQRSRHSLNMILVETMRIETNDTTYSAHNFFYS